MSTAPFSPIEQAFEDLKAGRFIILVDDEARENEGDLVIAAQFVTPEAVNFMLKHGRGVLCLPMSRERCETLNLSLQTADNTTKFGTAFTITVDAHSRFGVSTGVSAADRARTIEVACAPDTRPSDLARPGHVNPLMARDGGVLVRAGQTEGSVDLCRLAGLRPVATIIEIMNDDGTMARVPDLTRFAKKHGIRMYTVADVIDYRMQRETFVQRGAATKLPTKFGEFTLIAYHCPIDPEPHLALCCGGIGELDAKGRSIVHEEPVLVRVESECMTGHVFHSLRCDCPAQLDTSMELVQREGKGVVLYLRQEGRGIGLHNKIKAYQLQDEGLDTVEANEKLGLPVDRRDYGVGAHILRDLGVRRLRVLTNNPKKVNRLEVYGLELVEQIPIEIEPNEHNRHYLATKKAKMGHQLREV
ncbi:MAG: GTP cyclohydrolase II [Phycisphaerae bacterium]|jgi:3,4-dihydroxy 2-butanone 4-phosphate synthase/GTP cyclohydrolase II